MCDPISVTRDSKSPLIWEHWHLKHCSTNYGWFYLMRNNIQVHGDYINISNTEKGTSKDPCKSACYLDNQIQNLALHLSQILNFPSNKCNLNQMHTGFLFLFTTVCIQRKRRQREVYRKKSKQKAL